MTAQNSASHTCAPIQPSIPPFLVNPDTQHDLYIERQARAHRPLNSCQPDHVVINAFIDADDFQHQDACDIVSAWMRPTLPIVRVAKDDPRWIVEQWRLEMPINDDPFASSMRTAMSARSTRERLSDAASSMLATLSGLTAFEVEEAAEDAQGPAIVDAEDLAEPEPKSKPDKSQNDESDHSAPALPFDVSEETEIMAARVLKYAMRKAQSDTRLRQAGMAEDVAVNFTVYALQVIANGKYKETGKLNAWLKTRWGNFIGNERVKINRELARFTGHMAPNDDNPDAAVTPGYVSYDSGLFKSFSQFGVMQVFERRNKGGNELKGKVHKEKDAESVIDDELTFVLRRKLDALLPELTEAQRKIINLRSEGATYQDVAAALGISPRSVPRHLEAIKAKAVTAC